MTCGAPSVVMNTSCQSPSPVQYQLRARTRRSYTYHAGSLPTEPDNVQQLVDHFLADLSQRLDSLESFGHLHLDNGIDKAYSTLCAVREACAHVSDGMIGAGKRRARILVNTLEGRYHDVLATKETLEQKAQQAILLAERILADFESRSTALGDSSIGNMAHNIIGEGRRRVDESIEKAIWAKDSLREKVEHAIRSAKEHGLIGYHDLPEAWRVNPHILKGYRFHTAKLDCVRSVLSISNETFNIWSHATGLLIVLATAFYFYPSSPSFSAATTTDILVAAVFFFAACKCLVCSTMWHTMSSIAEKDLMERFACVDYTGISFLVAASIMTTEYTAFYCEPISQRTYLLVTAALGICGSILPWHPHFNRADKSWLRVGFYIALSATGLLPILQLTYTRGWSSTRIFYAPLVKSLVVYVVGALLYASKIPERWRPGMFDYVGGSHNIWHIAVLSGILFHYNAMHHFFAQAFQRAKAGCPS